MYDPFFRADNFRGEPWYEEFQIFLRIGVCMPSPEHLEAVKDALVTMGYSTIERSIKGEVYLCGCSEEAGENGGQ